MWFILESLPAMLLEALHEAGDRLVQGLYHMMQGVVIDTRLIGLDPGNIHSLRRVEPCFPA